MFIPVLRVTFGKCIENVSTRIFDLMQSDVHCLQSHNNVNEIRRYVDLGTLFSSKNLF